MAYFELNRMIGSSIVVWIVMIIGEYKTVYLLKKMHEQRFVYEVNDRKISLITEYSTLLRRKKYCIFLV